MQFCDFLNLFSDPLGALNSLASSFLATSFACSIPLFWIWKGLCLWHLLSTSTHSHCSIYPVFLSLHFIEPLLQFSRRFLIAVLALICNTLWVFPVLNFAAIGFTDNLFFYASINFHLCWDQVWIFSLDAIATPKWKSKNLWIIYYKWHSCPFLIGVNLPPASLIVWVGWNFQIFKAIKEWGLDVPIACLWLLHIFVGKPMYSGLVLYMNQFTSSTRRLWQPSVHTLLLLFFWPSYTCQQFCSLVIHSRQWTGTVMLKVQCRTKLNKNMENMFC